MSEGNFNNQPTRDRHAIGDFRVHLTADPVQGATKQPRLSVYYHKNRVSIEVRTNVPNDRDNGIIRAELDPPTFFAFLATLEETIRGGDGERPMRIKLSRPDFQKKNNGNPVLDSQLVLGKVNGVVGLSVVSWNKERPAIMFPFLLGKFVEFVKPDGSTWDRGELSVVVARGYLKMWENMIPQYMYNRYVAETFDRGNNQGGGNNNGGGNDNRGNRGQSYGNSSGGGDMRTDPAAASSGSTSEWDLPF